MPPLTENAQAILLLTAPLIVGRVTEGPKLLTPSEYKSFAQRLHENGHRPADLLGSRSAQILQESKPFIDVDRVKRLLGRGLQLGQAVERWQTRAIWVVSRADPDYPQRLKARLRGHAPAVLYGCGDLAVLNNGGLAVVGSRNVDEELFQFAMDIGQLAARAGRAVISGGAKGIDQAAMRGAAEAGGSVCGVLADSLEKQVMTRDHRNLLVEGQLTLVSPFDPNAGFNIGNAMQRNKVVYALADAALVVSSDVKKGGTWAGAIEQLDKFKLVQVYVRSTGKPTPGLEELRKCGALPWPNPETGEDLQALLDSPATDPSYRDLLLYRSEEPAVASEDEATTAMAHQTLAHTNVNEGTKGDIRLQSDTVIEAFESPAEKLFEAARVIIEDLAREPITDNDVADALRIQKTQAKAWLNRLVDEGVLEKRRKPPGYAIGNRKLI